jgi:hypothetical protein
MANLNINQFQQVPVRGEQDLQISRTGILTGIVSPNQATALKAGDFVIIDATVTAQGNIPFFKKADDDDVGLVCAIIHDVKKDSYAAGDALQVALPFGGPVIFMTAGATIAPGAAVEDNESGKVVTLASNKLRGYALDPGVTDQLCRILLYSGLS